MRKAVSLSLSLSDYRVRNRRSQASYTHTRMYIRVRARFEAERVLHVAQKLVPNYSDFLINVSADDDGACGSSFLSLFFPLPHTYAQLEGERGYS